MWPLRIIDLDARGPVTRTANQARKLGDIDYWSNRCAILIQNGTPYQAI